MIKKIRDDIAVLLIITALKASKLIPYRSIPKISNFLASVLVHFVGREKEIAITQIKIALKHPEPEKLFKDGLASLIMLVFEGARMDQLVPKQKVPIHERKDKTIQEKVGVVTFKNAKELQPLLDSGEGAVCLVSHTGNFELMAAYFISQGVPLTVIARLPNYKPLTNIIKEFRTSYGLDFIWREELGNPKKLLQTLRSGRFLSALIDQDTPLDSIFVPFFGIDAAYPRGPLSLAIRQKKAVFRAYATRLEDGSHTVVAERIPWENKFSPETLKDTIDAERYLAEEFSKGLENQIRKYPAQWVWWHRRWRRRPEDKILKPTKEYLEWLNQYQT